MTEQTGLMGMQHTAEQAADPLDNVKSRFLSNISHEMRTPLNGIIGSVRLLQMLNTEPDQEELLEGIRQSARRMMQLVENVLALTEVEAGRVSVSLEQWMPQVFLKDVAAAWMPAVPAPAVKIRTEIDLNVPVWLSGDREHLAVILKQWMDNAVKHTTKGEIVLRASLVDGDVHLPEGMNRWLEVSVSDTGIGIEPEVLPELFNSFRLVDDSYTRKYQGAGLGLMLCRKMADLMQARITVRSVPGEGSVFLLRLPVGVAEVNVGLEPGTVGKRQVLVVDDDETSRVLMSMFCQSIGIEPIVAQNAEKALEWYRCRVFDLILTDVQMPVMSGLELVALMRALETQSGSRTPIVAVTAYAMTGDRERILRAGFDDMLEKPVELHRFRETATRWLARTEAGTREVKDS